MLFLFKVHIKGLQLTQVISLGEEESVYMLDLESILFS